MSSSVSYATAAASTGKDAEVKDVPTTPKDISQDSTDIPSPSATPVESKEVESPKESKESKEPKESKAKSSSKDKDSSNNASKDQKTASAAAAEKKKPVSLTPAPVPDVNPWASKSSWAGQKSENGSVTAPASASIPAESAIHLNGSADSKKELDAENWPKPDEKKGSAVQSQGPGKVRTGKEKWVPYTQGSLGLTTPKPSSNRQSGNSIGSKGQGQGSKANGGGKFANGGVDSKSRAANFNGSANPKSNKFHQQQTGSKVANGGAGAGAQKTAASATAASSGARATTGTAPQKYSPVNGSPQFNGNSKPRYAGNNQVANGVHQANGGASHRGNFNNQGGFNGRRPSHFGANKGGAGGIGGGNFFAPHQEFFAQHMIPPPMGPNYDATLGLVIGQIEYYLSVENLCKDIFLRRQMNSKGLVPLSLLASFNRVKALTNGDMNILLEACRWSPSAEIVGNKVRPRIGWDMWVLPTNERNAAGQDESDTDTSSAALCLEADESVTRLEFNPAAAQPFVPNSQAQASETK